MSIKKNIAVLLSSFLFVFSVQAAYPTTIERLYYKSAQKKEIVGYWFVGCVVNNRLLIGTKTRFYEDEKPAVQCNRSSFNTGACIMARTNDLDWTSPTYGLEFNQEVSECIDLRDQYYGPN